MDKPTKDGVKTAVDHLIEMQEIKQVRKWLDVLRDTVDAGVDFELRGDAAFLQPLMDLRAHSMEKYTSVMNAMDDHRAASGLDRISTRPDKAAYVAAFVPIKRGRETRLARLWNEQFSSSQQLKGDARKAFMAMHARRWTEEKQARQEKLRTQSRRPLTMQEMRAIIAEVEDEIDLELDELEKFIQDEMRKPVSQRNPNGFKFRVGKL